MEQMKAMLICSNWFLGGKTSGALPYPKTSSDPEGASDRTATRGNHIRVTPSEREH
jgi:hypothetical protein